MTTSDSTARPHHELPNNTPASDQLREQIVDKKTELLSLATTIVEQDGKGNRARFVELLLLTDFVTTQ